MPRILFAWELGANLGHLTRDLPLARACRDAGHEVVVAVSNLRATVNLLGEEDFTIIQAPFLQSSIKRTTAPFNFPDMLLHEGYDDEHALHAALSGWEGLIKLVQPSVMIYNHAPTALLAAYCRNIPVMVMGTGFEIPPKRSPQPNFRPWQNIPETILRQSEEVVVSQINTQLARRGKDVITCLFDLYKTYDLYLTTFAELDHFGPRTGAHYLGPLYALPDAPQVTWRENMSKPRIFAYLHVNLQIGEQLLATLQNIDAEIICAIPEAPTEWINRYPRLRIFSHAIDLGNVLSTAHMTITYGASTIATSLLAGVPVLLVPQVAEQYLAGLALEKTGAGLMVRDPGSIEQFLNTMHNILAKQQYRQAATTFAQNHADFNNDQVLVQLLRAVEKKMVS